MPLDSVPVVPGANLLGHLHLISGDRLTFLRSIGRTAPVSRIRFMHRWVLGVSSPETAHAVLVEQARSFVKSEGIRVVLRDLAGEGLFTSEGELWKRQRRLMSPLFHTTQLASYAATMNAVARRALDRFEDGRAIDLAHEMTRITMGVVGATLFGADMTAEADEIGAALTIALKWVDSNVGSPLLTLQITLLGLLDKLRGRVPEQLGAVHAQLVEALRGPVLLPGRHDPELVNAIALLDERMQSMIEERRASRHTGADLLTRLLLARDSEGGNGEGMSDKQLRDEANTLFVAGHETTANALAWAFYLLARNPAAKARVQAEADAFGPEGPTTYAPEKLAYTTRVFKEALRLYPPVVFVTRRSLEPFELLGEEYPARTLALVNVYAIHRDPKVWPDPERFDPDRFTPEREAARHKSAWLPFGVGPRVCIGNGFALMEGPIVMATLMRNAQLEIDPRRTIDADAFLTLRPRGGVPARVRRASETSARAGE